MNRPSEDETPEHVASGETPSGLAAGIPSAVIVADTPPDVKTFERFYGCENSIYTVSCDAAVPFFPWWG